jgi:hypothetical protein
MTDDALRPLAGWLKPASIQLTADDLEMYRQVVTELAEPAIASTLVASGHGVIDDAARDTVEGALERHDPLFVSGDKDELIAILSAAAVFVALESSPTQTSVTCALLVQSAHFAGLKSKIGETAAAANRVIDQESRRLRTRLALRKSTVRKLLPAEAESADLVVAVNAGAKRIEDVLGDVQLRLTLMDEEIDALWWARSALSSDGRPWADMPPLERAILAALELSEIVTFYPPTLAQLKLVHDVGGHPEGSTTLLEIGAALATSKVAEFEGKGVLFPFTSAASLSLEHSDQPKAIGPLLSKTGWKPKQAIPLADVTEQLVREISLAHLS